MLVGKANPTPGPPGGAVVAVRVKPLADSAGKYASNAAASADRYATNAVGGAERWLQGAVAAARNFRQAVSAAGIEERFKRGVQRAGAGKYSARVQTFGAGRYSAGVGEAGDDWAQGFEPYQNTIAGLTLPARRPRGDPANMNRVSAVTNALTAKRMALLGTGGS